METLIAALVNDIETITDRLALRIPAEDTQLRSNYYAFTVSLGRTLLASEGKSCDNTNKALIAAQRYMAKKGN